MTTEALKQIKNEELLTLVEGQEFVLSGDINPNGPPYAVYLIGVRDLSDPRQTTVHARYPGAGLESGSLFRLLQFVGDWSDEPWLYHNPDATENHPQREEE